MAYVSTPTPLDTTHEILEKPTVLRGIGTMWRPRHHQLHAESRARYEMASRDDARVLYKAYFSGILLTVGRRNGRNQEGHHLPMKRGIYYCAMTMLLAFCACAWAESRTVARSLQDRKDDARATLRARQQRQQAAVQRDDPVSLHHYLDRNGTSTFTNRPEKYRRTGNYQEIGYELKPITVPQQYQSLKSPAEYTDASTQQLVRYYSGLYGLEENLVFAVIRAESNFNPNAVSSAGARGLMQLMPGTAAEMGVTKIHDPAQNIAGGTQYLAKMLELFNNDIRLALAAYNAGPERVKQYGGIPPFKETQDYVRKVLAFSKGYQSSGAKNIRLARNATKYPPPPRFNTENKRFIVHFYSGLTQPADNVTDKDPYYYINYGSRTYPVRKDLVKSIEEPA